MSASACPSQPKQKRALRFGAPFFLDLSDAAAPREFIGKMKARVVAYSLVSMIINSRSDASLAKARAA